MAQPHNTHGGGCLLGIQPFARAGLDYQALQCAA
jgi:hypothetical protein